MTAGDLGVIDVALLSVIRRWHFREGMPIREIARRTGLSRNTVRKYLAQQLERLQRYADKLVVQGVTTAS